MFKVSVTPSAQDKPAQDALVLFEDLLKCDQPEPILDIMRDTLGARDIEKRHLLDLVPGFNSRAVQAELQKRVLDGHARYIKRNLENLPTAPYPLNNRWAINYAFKEAAYWIQGQHGHDKDSYFVKARSFDELGTDVAATFKRSCIRAARDLAVRILMEDPLNSQLSAFSIDTKVKELLMVAEKKPEDLFLQPIQVMGDLLSCEKCLIRYNNNITIMNDRFARDVYRASASCT